MDKQEKEKRIKKEIKKLNKLFENIASNKKSLIENLINQSAWLSVTIAELEESINEDGLLEVFEQGIQKFQRENSNTKTIISLQKNYLAIIKQLNELLPEETEQDDVDTFLNG